MANELEWHKFYLHRWSGDRAVRLMTVEQVGAYWMLLVEQMHEGDLPEDPRKLAALLKNMDVDHFLKNIWENDATFPVKEKFKPVEGKPGFIHNEHLTRVMLDDKSRRSKQSEGGKQSWLVRSGGVTESSIPMPATTADGPTIDLAGVLKSYPKRNDTKGWSFGVKMAEAAIDTVEDRDRLHAAIKAYAKEARTVSDRKYIKRLDTFMKEWEQWVPTSYVAPTAAAPVETSEKKEETPKPAPEKRVYPAAWLAPPERKRELPAGQKPPWLYSNPFDVEGNRKVREMFPNDEAKIRWWLTPETTTPTDQHAGA